MSLLVAIHNGWSPHVPCPISCYAIQGYTWHVIMSSCHVMSSNIQCCVPTCCYPGSCVPMSRGCRCWARTGCRLGPALVAMEDTEDSLASPCTPPPPQPLKVPTNFRDNFHNIHRRHPIAPSITFDSTAYYQLPTSESIETYYCKWLLKHGLSI